MVRAREAVVTDRCNYVIVQRVDSGSNDNRIVAYFNIASDAINFVTSNVSHCYRAYCRQTGIIIAENYNGEML